MITLLGILFATAFTFAVCVAAGRMALTLARVTLYRTEELFLEFVTGAAILSTLVFLVSVAGLASVWTFLILGIILIATAWRYAAAPLATQNFTPLPAPFRWLFGLVFAVFTVTYLINALAPECSPDGAMFHVALPARYLREHRIPAITTNMLACFSEGVEMLYLFAFSFGKHSATAMVHLLFTAMTAFGILSYGRRIGYPIAGVVASLLFYLSPIVGKDGTSAYLDVAVAGVLFTAFYLFTVWSNAGGGNLKALVPLGMVAGFAYAVKYTAFLSLAFVLVAMIVHLLQLRKSIWKPCGIVIVSAGLMCAPWVLKNVMVIGNPVAPLGNTVFPNRYFYPSIERDYQQGMASLGGGTWKTWPLEVTLQGGRPQGIIGPVFLLAPLALLAAFTPPGRWLLCAAVVFLAPYPFATATRFLVPALPFVSLALAIALARWRVVAILIILVHGGLSWPEYVTKYAPYAWRLRKLDWRAALRLTPEDKFLRARMDDYDIGRLIDANVRPGERIFSPSGFEQAYHSGDVAVEWQSAIGVKLGEVLRAGYDRDWQPGRYFEASFHERTARKLRVIRTAPVDRDWKVFELRFFQGGREVSRKPAWRVRSASNPWDVQLAFDNHPLTRWSSRGYRNAPMFIEVDFGGAESVDRVRVEGASDEDAAWMRLEVETEPGQWASLAAFLPVQLERAPRLRRAAVEYIEQSGIRWLVVHQRDNGARDFFTRQAQWGIRLVGEAAPYRLYRLE